MSNIVDVKASTSRKRKASSNSPDANDLGMGVPVTTNATTKKTKTYKGKAILKIGRAQVWPDYFESVSIKSSRLLLVAYADPQYLSCSK